MASDYLPPLSKKKTSRDFDPVPRLLREWYGEEDGASAVTARLPKPKPVKDLVDKALGRLAPPELALLEKIRRDWNNLAGTGVASFAFPARIRNGTLEIEVTHPAYLAAFGAAEKTMLLDKIHVLEGGGACVAIRTIPKGSRNERTRR